VQLVKGQSERIGDVEVRFVKFNLDMDGNALVAMRQGKTVVIGAELAITKNGRTSSLTPVYRLNAASGSAESPPTPLPGGGEVYVSGINANSGAVQLDLSGVSNPAKLSIDVTQKPLIQLVWGGLYVVLIGGVLTLIQRFRQMRVMEAIEETRAGAA